MRLFQNAKLLQDCIERHRLSDLFSLDLTQNTMFAEFEEGEIIAYAGDLYPYFLLIVGGECMAYSITEDDKIHCEEYYKGLNFMGFVGVLLEKPCLNNVKAMTKLTCIALPAEYYRGLLLNDVKFLRYAVLSLSSHIRMQTIQHEPFEMRLAQFILGSAQDGKFCTNLTICAERLDTSYRHLLRVLRRFCECGLLQKTGRGVYRLQNKELLRTLSATGSAAEERP